MRIKIQIIRGQWPEEWPKRPPARIGNFIVGQLPEPALPVYGHTHVSNPCSEIALRESQPCILSADANGFLSIDGVTLETNDRILQTGSADARDNGIYTVTRAGDSATSYTLTRE